MTKEEMAKEFIESLKTYQRAPGLADIWLSGFERGQRETIGGREVSFFTAEDFKSIDRPHKRRCG
jgi:hypothetical protein